MNTDPFAALLAKSKEPKTDEAESDDGLGMAAEELLSAIEAKDREGVVSALRSAFEILDSQPHEEGSHAA